MLEVVLVVELQQLLLLEVVQEPLLLLVLLEVVVVELQLLLLLVEVEQLQDADNGVEVELPLLVVVEQPHVVDDEVVELLLVGEEVLLPADGEV